MSLPRVAVNSFRAAARPAVSYRTPTLIRCAGGEARNPSEAREVASPNEPPAERAGRAGTWSAVRTEGAAEGQPRHAPDYDVAADNRISAFSPVPMRVQDGSEPGLDTPAAVLSGAPTDLQARTVRIFRPSKTATQSGDWHSHTWRMDWDILSKGHRWENPLMGWQSSADYMQGTHLNFKSKE
ncbi:NADH-ubiquinone oxidoreductase 21 kDa subunit, partial [Hortaea werneckii]